MAGEGAFGRAHICECADEWLGAPLDAHPAGAFLNAVVLAARPAAAGGVALDVSLRRSLLDQARRGGCEEEGVHGRV